MDAFAASYLSELIAGLTAMLIEGASRRMREALGGDERQQAFRRCVEAGVLAMFMTAHPATTEERDLLADILERFFADADVAREFVPLLRGEALKTDELLYLFTQAGYDAETLPGIEFSKGLRAFEVAFLTAAHDEPLLTDIVQTGQLEALVRRGDQLLAMVRELLTFLRHARPGTVGIQADSIVAQNVVNGTQIVYQIVSAPVSHMLRDWERNYLEAIIVRHDALDLSPIDEAYTQGGRRDEAPVVHVSDVYTTLHLARIRRTAKQTVEEALRQFLHPQERPDGEATRPTGRRREPKSTETTLGGKDEKLVPISVIETIAVTPRLVILGAPGGGKSTVVNYLATQLAHRRLGDVVAEEHLPGWPAATIPLPVLITLRHFAAWLPGDAPHGHQGMVWDYIQQRCYEMGCREVFPPLKDTLYDEGGVFFFDGLDEVRETDEEAKRSLIVEAITDLASLPRCRIVITCREYAYRPGAPWRLPEETFPVVELDLFDRQQIETFVHTWYRVLGPQKGWGTARCQSEAQHLYTAIQNWPPLNDLASYPLLLTLMAQLHGRDGYLPQNRADLYARIVSLLLARWENRIIRDVRGGRGVESDQIMVLGVRADALRNALERVAFAVHERQGLGQQRNQLPGNVPRMDLLEELEKELGSLDRANEVVAYIQQRAGLLQGRDNQTYAFQHRTFQEYLAATYILKQADLDTMLRDRVRQDLAWWREVYLLATGASRSTPRVVYDIVNCLLPWGTERQPLSSERAAHAQLAAQALWECGFVEHVRQEREPGHFTAIYERTQGWLLKAIRAGATLPPRERAEAGNALARLGDTRVEVTTLEGMRFCHIPAGPFWMGAGQEKQHLNEHLGYDYWLAQYPVTVAQYRQFVQGSGQTPEDPDCLRGLDNHPVVRVSWREARAFCAWLTREWRTSKLLPEDREARLPSEAEWEKAARGGVQLPPSRPASSPAEGWRGPEATWRKNDQPQRGYPWGNEKDPNLANYDETGIHATSAVGCFAGGASPYGVEELSGNVMEWTRSQYEAYPYDPRDGRESLEAGSDVRRVVRGGSFDYIAGYVRCAYRLRYDPDNRFDDLGFRMVVAPVS